MIIYKNDTTDIELNDKKYTKIFKQVKYVDNVKIIKRVVEKQNSESYNIYFLFFEYAENKYNTKIFYSGQSSTMEAESNNSDPEIFYAFKLFLNTVGEK